MIAGMKNSILWAQHQSTGTNPDEKFLHIDIWYRIILIVVKRKLADWHLGSGIHQKKKIF